MAIPNSRSKVQLSRRQIEALYLAGTVSIPRQFPELGRIWYWPPGAVHSSNRKHASAVLCVEQKLSLSVTVTRSCLLADVAAIFVPRTPDCVDYTKGTLLLTEEIESTWARLRKDGENAVRGIIYIAEAARVLTEISLGMTAAQSADYVPPLASHAWPDPMPEFCDPVGCVP